MWKHRYGFVCVLIALTALSALVSFAATVDPSTLPLIQFADLSYIGAFRLPAQFTNGDSFSHGGSPVTYNPSRNTLYVGSRKGNVAEVSIPGLVVNNDISKLQFGGFVQAFFEPTEGTIAQIAGSSISGLLVHGEQLYGTATMYYDANNVQRVSHYARSKTLSIKSAVGMKQVWEDAHAGLVSGYMAMVPPEWQERLGGPAVTGQCCIPIAWRTSWGPSAFAWNPPNMFTYTKVPALPLLYYPDAHPTIGHWERAGSVFTATTEITGLALLAGTRTALYFGRNGTGPFCYGIGTQDPNLVGKMSPDGGLYCADPTSDAKGPHAYPYNYQIWAYDLNDFAAVRAGTKLPWDVKPYGVWPFQLPHPEKQVRLGGIGYDPSRQIIYVSQIYADQDVYEYRPLIHALKVGGGAVGLPLPAPDTTPLPPVTTTASSSPGGNRLTALALTANKTAPQPAGTTITFSATPTGGVAPHQYKWLVHDGVKWIEMTGWSTASTFNWTPSLANSQHRVGVWVRSDGNTSDVSQFTASMDFAIGNSATWTPPYAATASVSITANKVAPQAAGSVITWTAAPARGTAPHQYKWMVHNGVQWNTVADWSTSNTFVWTPALPNSGYRIGTWVRSAGATGDAPDATTSADFPINGTATSTTTPAPTPTTPPPGARLLAVSLTANKAAPQPAGTTVTFSAVPNGGAAPHQYKWLVHNGVAWAPIADWSTSNTFNWTPASSNASYRVGVWVKNAGVTGDTPQVTNSVDFPVSAGSSSSAPPPATTPTSTGRLTAVSLTADKPAPQRAGTSITFTSVPTGGATPHQYKWLLHNGIAWAPLTGWSTSNAFTWTPPTNVNNPAYRIGVWVRSAGLTADAPEMSMSMNYPITEAVFAAPPPPTSTSSGSLLTAVSLTANRVAPQPAGTTVTFSAAPNGGVAPHQYKWLVHNGVSWAPIADWSTSNTFNWTPASSNASYRVGVWVRNAGVASDTPQVTNSVDFPVSAGAPAPPSQTTTTTPISTGRLIAVSLNADKPAPQLPNTAIAFTAMPTGGATPHQYKWLVHNGRTWNPVTEWTTSNVYTWTPFSSNAAYRVGVWVRSAGLTADTPEMSMSMDYPISSTPPPPPATTAAQLTAVTLGANKIAPQLPGSPITFTAVPNGGAAPHSYKWLVHNGVQWSAVGGWTTSNTFIWTPATANSSYRIGVWVRTAGKTADVADVTMSMNFPIWK